MKTIVCCIGWMEDYKGQTQNDKILGGGKYVDDYGTGGEIYNFYSRNGKYYGYVRNQKSFNLKDRFDCSDDHVDNITVIWVSRNLDKDKIVVIGWYTNARMHKYMQEMPFKVNSKSDEDGYYFEALEEDCVLLPSKKRTLECPTGKGGLGKNRFFYPESEVALEFINKVTSLIEQYKLSSQKDIDEQFDIEEIEKNLDIPQTTKDQMIQARRGQGKFRQSLLSLYPECPITKINLNTLLRASHIKPWRACDDKEKLDPSNGIILSVHLDALFDKGYISFNDDGSLLIKESCIDSIDKMNIDKSIKIKVHDQMKKYLSWHRDNLFNSH